jgi:hypothetical protein
MSRCLQGKAARRTRKLLLLNSLPFMTYARHLAALALTLGCLHAADTANASLEEMFKNPPVKARPYVWWHWMGSNFSKEGITKDLEAMKEAGIGGATIFNIASAVQESHKPTLNNPWPDQTYRSPKYWEAIRHAADEAKRLGLEIGLHNTVGYSTTGGPWIDEERSMRKIVSKNVTVEGGQRVSIELPRPDPVVYRGWGNTGQEMKSFHDIAVLAAPAEGVVDPAKVVDLTSSFRNGRLTWNAPAGKWQIYRICSAPTGSIPHPLPDELIGKTLEVDKMSRTHNEFHWDQVIEPLKQHLGDHLGKTFRHFLIDSYEAGGQNWTEDFREEFQKRKGYDPLPWLLTLKERQVGNADLTARFQWDFNDVIHTLFHEHGWLTGQRKMKKVGMDLQFEPYTGPFDTVDATTLADIPMGEFWSHGSGGINGTIVAAARAAGRTVVGAEAYTGPPTASKWSETPSFLKKTTDPTFASGVNRMILHHWVHQPFDDRYKPGMGMGWWGTHFNRHQTWARDGVAFFQYLGRCQALLQAGEAPADFVSVGKPQGGDVIPWRLFRDGLVVRDGLIVLPSGRSYPFLGIPHDGELSPADLKRIAGLLDQGAVIVCAEPKRAPGLAGYPQSDREVAAMAGKLWNDEPVRRVGKGRLHTRGDIQSAIREAGITPLVQIRGASDIMSSARVTGDATLFFVANRGTGAARFTASLRVSGKRPELWDAEDGTIRFAPIWRQKDGRTEVDLTLSGQKSVFLVFRDAKLPADYVVNASIRNGGDALEILKARFGSPDGNRWMDVTSRLRELAHNGSLQIDSIHPGVFGRDPAPNVVKKLELEYRQDDKVQNITLEEKQSLRLTGAAQPELHFETAADGSLGISANAAAKVELTHASGKRTSLELSAPPAAATLAGPWQVTLNSPVDETRTIELPALADLTRHQDPAVKYFSGTASYVIDFELPDTSTPMHLDLGQVHDLARITLNGKDLGVLWHAPFALDISTALKPGKNRLEIAVTNTWHNRLVGDEQLPADFEWGEDRAEKGRAMKGYPDWFIKNQPRPEQGRKCFVVWYYHRKDTPLLPAGLLGPVRLIPLSVAAR